ncbi:MAG: virulence factor, partial [Sneathiella sp.]|nr:virulence factor [Sneathiella sp.]
MQVTIIYWRDIPSQVVTGTGRKKSKLMMPDRFQEAIDMAAMRDKAHESDAYLDGWRKENLTDFDGTSDNIAASVVTDLEAKFDEDLLKS